MGTALQAQCRCLELWYQKEGQAGGAQGEQRRCGASRPAGWGCGWPDGTGAWRVSGGRQRWSGRRGLSGGGGTCIGAQRTAGWLSGGGGACIRSDSSGCTGRPPRRPKSHVWQLCLVAVSAPSDRNRSESGTGRRFPLNCFKRQGHARSMARHARGLGWGGGGPGSTCSPPRQPRDSTKNATVGEGAVRQRVW